MPFVWNSIWVTIILLSVLVVVHEYGHFLMARIFGVKVFEFSVGFGPLIGKVVRNGIQYSFRWILLGGYVKIAGMDIALEGSPSENEPKKVEAEKGEPSEKLSPEESFEFLPLWKQISVIAAGPIFNFVFAIILFFVTASCIGYPDFKNVPIIGGVATGSPAYQAGLQAEDRIISLNGQPITQWTEMTALIQKYGGKPIQVQFIHNGETRRTELVPTYSPKEKRYLMGVTLKYIPFLRHESIADTAQKAVSLPIQIIEQLGKIFTGKAKADFMGPIGIVDMVEKTMHFPFAISLANLLFYAAEISISLFIFNLLPLPLPLLDGGWIVIMLIERAIRRQFSAEQKAIAQLIGIAAVIILGILIGYHDVLRFGK